MKTKQRLFIGTLSMLYFGPCICLQSVAQDQFLSTSKNINPFYVFTEGGAAYMPNIGFKDWSISASTGGNSASFGYSDLNVSTEIGYNFLGGIGYALNKNLSLELEAGFISNNISKATFNLNATLNGTSGSISGFTAPLNGASIQQIPICMNLVIMNPDLSFRPMVGIGLGACPTRMDLGTYRFDLTQIGAGVYDLDAGSYTATPFLIKLKAGLGYSFSPNLDVGVRAFVNILTGSDFGDGPQSNVYSVIGVNGNMTVRF
jgi:hypothetical protein